MYFGTPRLDKSSHCRAIEHPRQRVVQRQKLREVDSGRFGDERR